MAKQKPIKRHNPIAVEAATVPVEAPVIPSELIESEVISDEREQSIRIDGALYHHTRESADGRWIYRPLRG